MARLLLLITALFWAVSSFAASATIPRACHQYRDTLVREARYVYGLEAPVSLLAGQITQESACNPRAKSLYAEGLTQFTPDTVKWLANLYPKQLGDFDIYNPTLAIRGLVLYDKKLFDGVKGHTDCDRWNMALWGYNGGPGWVIKDKKKATALGLDPLSYLAVKPINAGRAPQFFKENRDYPERIIFKYQPMYYRAGWSTKAVCYDK